MPCGELSENGSAATPPDPSHTPPANLTPATKICPRSPRFRSQIAKELTKNVNLTHLCGRFFICFVPNGPEVA